MEQVGSVDEFAELSVTVLQDPALHALHLAGAAFFQAEFCIRDFHVTGVQTCALPIYRLEIDPAEAELVREGVKRILAGETATGIALDWTRRGIRGVRGGALDNTQ